EPVRRRRPAARGPGPARARPPRLQGRGRPPARQVSTLPAGDRRARAPRRMRPLAALRELLAVAALVFLLLLFCSGLGLMATYGPSGREAFDSVLFLRKQGGILAFLRNLHGHLASGLVSAGFLYLVASYLLGEAPRRPRAWWTALALFFL